MGNVYAAAPPPSTNMALSPPTLPPPQAAGSPGEVAQQPPSNADDNNPGTYEDLHKKCKELFPQNFEGGKLIISKSLSSHFQVSHTINMSGTNPALSGYRFGTTYIGSKQLSPSEVYPVIIGDVDASGNLNANIIHAFSQRLRSKLVSQFQDSKCTAAQGTLDYKGDDYTASLTVGNLDIINNSGIAITQYLQTVTSRLALGGELVYQYGPQIPGKQFTVLSLAARISGEKWQLTGNYCPTGGAMHACYHHKVSDQLQVAAEVETSIASRESVGTIGYQLEIPSTNVTFKGQLDTNWSVGGTMEKKLMPLPFTFALSGMANFANIQKPQYRFGIGLIVG
ncbi:mitochondrial import receptor subunit TOM40 homolog 1-like [Mizuhopecten yessoensis]|uniref:mitochondrial import receptor subunit TOM40 homolog 1-like n=1 Tax=Mizuhopecten yessoensis TaxID=6573 RepID=UPI000B45E873|nr:mitochondrial import receptor subunit TOM40 homolog 1-like [Mizuhopecten yessoensis]